MSGVVKELGRRDLVVVTGRVSFADVRPGRYCGQVEVLARVETLGAVLATSGAAFLISGRAHAAPPMTWWVPEAAAVKIARRVARWRADNGGA